MQKHTNAQFHSNDSTRQPLSLRLLMPYTSPHSGPSPHYLSERLWGPYDWYVVANADLCNDTHGKYSCYTCCKVGQKCHGAPILCKKQLKICAKVLSNKFQFKWQDDLESNHILPVEKLNWTGAGLQTSPRKHLCNVHSEQVYSHLCHTVQQNCCIFICVAQLLYTNSKLHPTLYFLWPLRRVWCAPTPHRS